jgi:hypothetical protein
MPLGAGAVPALRPHRQQWHQLRGRLRCRLRLLSLGLGIAIVWLAPQPAGHAGGFGRWHTSTSQCSLRRGPSILVLPCQELRLEQNLEGLLSVRFISSGDGDLTSREHLLFAGLLEEGQRPMRCGEDGRCSPQWPTSLVVAGVADASFDGRGLVMGLPRTQLAQGRCELNRRSVRCEAHNAEGSSWQAEAEL